MFSKKQHQGHFQMCPNLAWQGKNKTDLAGGSQHQFRKLAHPWETPMQVPSDSRLPNRHRNCREELRERNGPVKHQPSRIVSLNAQRLGHPDLQSLIAARRPTAIPQEVAPPVPAQGTGGDEEDHWEFRGHGMLRNWKMNSSANWLGCIQNTN